MVPSLDGQEELGVSRSKTLLLFEKVISVRSRLISAILTMMPVLIFGAAGVVYWPQALLMMVTATVGGYLGALIAQRARPQHLRAGIVIVGLIMTTLFFMSE